VNVKIARRAALLHDIGKALTHELDGSHASIGADYARRFNESEAVANAIGFLAIALIVMGLAGIAGKILSRTLHYMGLGFLDRLAGGAFGFLQGALLVPLCILVAVAFFPQAHWLTQAQLPRFFFGACHLSTHMSPAELAERVREGLNMLEQQSPRWMHPGIG